MVRCKAIISADASTPTTAPSGTRAAISAITLPLPQPKSSTALSFEIEKREGFSGHSSLKFRHRGVFSCIPFGHFASPYSGHGGSGPAYGSHLLNANSSKVLPPPPESKFGHGRDRVLEWRSRSGGSGGRKMANRSPPSLFSGEDNLASNKAGAFPL